jgi:hypothetical protein
LCCLELLSLSGATSLVSVVATELVSVLLRLPFARLVWIVLEKVLRHVVNSFSLNANVRSKTKMNQKRNLRKPDSKPAA